MPTPPPIFLIRHGEKPTPTTAGVDLHGRPDPDSLSPLGWQRAGALVPFFTRPTPPIRTPATLFATSPEAPGADPSSTSRRNQQTAQPLADRLALPLNRGFGKGQELALAAAARTAPGPVLIVWTHNGMLALLRALCPTAALPTHWPSHRFDLVLLLEPTGPTYTLHQLPQLLLAGDSPDLLPLC